MSDDPAVFSVREAKNRFSELVRRAADGERITIASHGHPRAQLARVQEQAGPLHIDWDWLRTMKASERGLPSELLVREDRDSRD